MVKTTCGAQCLVFPKVLDGERWEAVGNGIDEWLEDGLLVIADNEDFLDLGDVRDRAEAMLDDRVTGDRKEGLSVN